jgi:3,4-dihydroxy 2-butanone 4-phosphate synthase / GTP cyclohydrolase II
MSFSADPLSSVDLAVAAIAQGGMVIVVDDTDRENEADLVAAADAVTPEIVNFMVTHARGLLCVPIEGPRLDDLRIPNMVTTNGDPHGTSFTVSVDLDVPGSTGISARNRAETIRALADPSASAGSFRMPGHIFPLRYAEGGVLARRGHTEASVDLARLAGRQPAAAICEILADDGTMLSGRGVQDFAEEHRLPVVSVAELVEYRRTRDPLRVVDFSAAKRRSSVERVAETVLPTEHGLWRAVGYRDLRTGAEHLALVLGDLTDSAPLVRVHSECLTGDVFGSHRCDCGPQLDAACRMIAKEGRGVVVYVGGHEGRGIGLLNKLRAYRLQDHGRDTLDANLDLGLPADARHYDQSVDILADLGIHRLRLLTNNPDKVAGLRTAGLDVLGVVPLQTRPTPQNTGYLLTKQTRMGHTLGDDRRVGTR